MTTTLDERDLCRCGDDLDRHTPPGGGQPGPCQSRACGCRYYRPRPEQTR